MPTCLIGMVRSRLHAFVALVVVTVLLGAAPAWGQFAAVGDGGPGPVKAQHLTAELQTTATEVRPGASVDAGLVITLEQGWHVYWVNAGDAGEPPQIAWTLPKGVTASAMEFPIPTRLPLQSLMDFGYEDGVTLPFKVSVAKDAKPGPAHLGAVVTWVVCREVCVPGKARMGLNLQVNPGAPNAPAPTVGALDEARTLLPKPLPPGAKVTVDAGAKDFVVTLLTGGKPDDAEIYPYDGDLILNAADQDTAEVPGGIRVWVPRAAELKELPKTFHALIRLSDTEGYEFTAPVVRAEVPEPAAAAKGGGAAGASELTAATAIGLAFLGGVLLNLMPCVFPVLFLKGAGAGAELGRGAVDAEGARAGVHGGDCGELLAGGGGAAGAAVGDEPDWVGVSTAVAVVCGDSGDWAVFLCAVAGGAV